jgi:hypothetical protein
MLRQGGEISKIKSQGSAASDRKTLQSQIRPTDQNRISINVLDVVHGRPGKSTQTQGQAATAVGPIGGYYSAIVHDLFPEIGFSSLGNDVK